MKLFLGGKDVTQLAASVSTSGSKKECARTLQATIVQSPSDKNLPSVAIKSGMAVVMSDADQYFVGIVMNFSKSTASNTLDITAKDFGIYVKKNKVSYKVTALTPEAAAADICAQYGVPVGSMAPTGFVFSRIYMGVTLYDAIMTGYTLAAAQTGKKYQLVMEGTAVSVVERGAYVAAVISPKQNLIEASYSEDIEDLINQVDIYDEKGNLVQSVMGDTSYGIVRDQLKVNKKEDTVAKAEQMLKDHGVVRNGSVRNIGNAACVSGAAVLIKEEYTGLYGKFWISSDTHQWKSGIYTNALTLEFENTMDEKSAGQALDAQKTSNRGKNNKGTIYRDPWGNEWEGVDPSA